MLTSDEQRRLAEIELVVRATDRRLADNLKRFGRSAVPRWATACALAGGWVLDAALVKAGHWIPALFLMTPLLAATAIWGAQRG
jgi:fatty acid desaturase